MKGVKDWAIDCLKRPGMGHRKGGGRKETTLRVIELSSIFDPLPRYRDSGLPVFHLGSVKVEEYKVRGVDGEGP